MKLAVLLAIVLAGRSSDLAMLTVTGVKFVPLGVELIPDGVSKQAKPGKGTKSKTNSGTQFSREINAVSSRMPEGLHGDMTMERRTLAKLFSVI